MDDAREVAFTTLFLKKKQIDPKVVLKPADFNLAYEITQGVKRKSLSLDHFLSQLQEKIKLKESEKILLHMALYQFLFMEKIPLYAICDETIKLAKKHCRKERLSFLNALLRKFEKTSFFLPKGQDLKSLSIFYSYPEYFITKLIDDVGLDQTKEILEIQNQNYPLFARARKGEFVIIDSKKKLDEIKEDSNYYIQNPTFFHLIQDLVKVTPKPKSILDLCASPGGKLLLASEIYPQAKLYANDLPNKIARLKENCEKYQIDPVLFSEDATQFSSDQKFDLIILDLPCSNSGVLHKRAEARWRIIPENLIQLNDLQEKILQNALSLLSKDGVIWYLTCSILSIENQKLIETFIQNGKVSLLGKMHTIYPDREGHDGGFGCVLKK